MESARHDFRRPRSRAATVAAACVLLGVIVRAGDAPRDQAEGPAHYAVVLCGVSGDQVHFDKFWKLVTQARKLFVERLGFREQNVFVLFENPDPEGRIVHDKSTKENLLALLKELGGKLKQDDMLFLFIIGHAGSDGQQVKIHLPGPDIAPKELGEAVNALPQCRQLVVVGTPVSGYFMAPLSKAGRVVITATRPTAEISETVFPYCFIEAFLDKEVDADGDGLVSVAEVFNGAVRRVREFYTKLDLIPTEHARLNDSGAGGGSEFVDEKMPDGKVAGQWKFRVRTVL